MITFVFFAEMDDLVLLMRQVHFTANVTQPQVLTTFPTPIDPNQLCGRSTKDNSLVTNTRFYVAGVSVGATGSLGLFGKKSTDYLYTCVFSYISITYLQRLTVPTVATTQFTLILSLV